jgi:hypothetical protein
VVCVGGVGGGHGVVLLSMSLATDEGLVNAAILGGIQCWMMKVLAFGWLLLRCFLKAKME